MPRARPPAVPALALAAIALAASAMLAGCQLAGIAADRLAGKPPVPAVYVPGAATPVLVLVENFRDPALAATDADRVGRMVASVLASKKAADVVAPDKLLMVRDARPGAFARMSVVDIGKAVGAQKVIYIDLGGIGVGTAQGSDMLKGVAHASVRVIDVNSGSVAFPADASEGYPVDYTSPLRRGGGGTTPDTVRGETLIGLSTRIAQLFYSYEPGDMESLGAGM